MVFRIGGIVLERGLIQGLGRLLSGGGLRGALTALGLRIGALGLSRRVSVRWRRVLRLRGGGVQQAQPPAALGLAIEAAHIKPLRELLVATRDSVGVGEIGDR